MGTLLEEAQKLEAEAQCLEACGLEKMEAEVAGSEVEGFYGLLMGAMSHSSMSSAPSATISHLPPQESEEHEAPGHANQVPE